jgi:KEOPS complex subunit Pcc1
MLSAKLTIVSEDADTIARSLKPESERDISRTHVEVSCSDGKTVVDIESADTTAMRAALNSYLGCIRITEDIGRITR